MSLNWSKSSVLADSKRDNNVLKQFKSSVLADSKRDNNVLKQFKQQFPDDASADPREGLVPPLRR